MKVNRIYEKHTGHSKSMKLKVLKEISKSICEIKIKDFISTGFFMKFEYKGDLKFFLITTSHLISYLNDKKEKSFEIICDAGIIKQEISFNTSKRMFINNDELGFLLMEIFDNDLIKDKVKFLESDSQFDNNMYTNFDNKDIFIMHHPKGEELECNSGKIIMSHIQEVYFFQHNLDTNEGSFGSPILLLQKGDVEPKVFGIHILENNIGIFINYLIDSLKNNQFEYIDFLHLPEGHKVETPYNSKIVINKIYTEPNSILLANGPIIFGGDKNDVFKDPQENIGKIKGKSLVIDGPISTKDIGELYWKGDCFYVKNKESLKYMKIIDKIIDK